MYAVSNLFVQRIACGVKTEVDNMARNVLVLTLIGIGVFIGEVSQYSSHTEDITATEPISKVSQTYRFEKKFAVMAVFLTSLKIREIS